MGIYYLPQLIEAMRGDIRKFLSQDLRINSPFEETKEIYKALERVPIVDLKYSVVAVDDRNNPLAE